MKTKIKQIKQIKKAKKQRVTALYLKHGMLLTKEELKEYNQSIA